MSNHVYNVTIDRNVSMKTRDGVILRSDVYRPVPITEGETFPVLLVRTPYNKNFDYFGFTAVTEKDYFPKRGYIVIVQDTRGRYESEGEFYPFKYEADDGYDAVEWAAGIPGSNGKVGTIGQSYMGFTQLALASRRPPHLVAMSVVSGFCWLWDNCVYRQGIFELDFMLKYLNMLARGNLQKSNQIDFESDLDAQISPPLWGSVLRRAFNFLGWRQLSEFFNLIHPLNEDFVSELPLTNIGKKFEEKGIPWISDFLEHHNDRDWWQKLCGILPDPNNSNNTVNIDVPIFHIGSWYDYFQWTTLRLFEMLRSETKSHQKIWMGPWGHLLPYSKPTSGGAGDIDFGPNSKVHTHDEQLRWFDYYLKGIDNGVTTEPPVKLFVMGKNANYWRDEPEWPLQRAVDTCFYLSSGGHANGSHGDGKLVKEPDCSLEDQMHSSDTYEYNPLNPVPTNGGCIIAASWQMGVHDQSQLEKRDDVLIYTSDLFNQETEITGTVQVKLFAKTTVEDTDWSAKLVVIHKDGFCQNLVDGITRARFRNVNKEELLERKKVYEYTIDLWTTSYVISPGERIRLEISSSNFPRYARSSNTGLSNPNQESIPIIAKQTVLHCKEYPSCVTLPLIVNK